MIDKLAEIPLLFQPGERWVYSIAVDLQGFMIERWTGQKLDDFLQERLFDPLGMDQTMTWAPPEQAALLADVHTHADGKLTIDSTPISTNNLRAPGHFAGGGQLLSTSDDYWRFAQMLLNDGEFDGERFLAPSSVEMMSADRLPFPFVGFYGEIGFGLNFAVIDDPLKVAYPASAGEYFWAGVVTTLFWIDPEEELVVVMMTQYTPFNEPYFRDLMHRMVHAAIIE
jgi:CubicO group peptidase (beta-lactamase class C family)